eukprot:Rhum_TRINITY_DN15017_c1_g3::Rhum_TRINITY_DN15017_c1_g3_i1::g.133563::m.133563
MARRALDAPRRPAPHRHAAAAQPEQLLHLRRRRGRALLLPRREHDPHLALALRQPHHRPRRHGPAPHARHPQRHPADAEPQEQRAAPAPPRSAHLPAAAGSPADGEGDGRVGGVGEDGDGGREAAGRAGALPCLTVGEPPAADGEDLVGACGTAAAAAADAAGAVSAACDGDAGAVQEGCLSADQRRLAHAADGGRGSVGSLGLRRRTARGEKILQHEQKSAQKFLAGSLFSFFPHLFCVREESMPQSDCIMFGFRIWTFVASVVLSAHPFVSFLSFFFYTRSEHPFREGVPQTRSKRVDNAHAEERGNTKG